MPTSGAAACRAQRQSGSRTAPVLVLVPLTGRRDGRGRRRGEAEDGGEDEESGHRVSPPWIGFVMTEDEIARLFLRGQLLRVCEVGCGDCPRQVDRSKQMAVTESGHLASSAIDDLPEARRRDLSLRARGSRQPRRRGRRDADDVPERVPRTRTGRSPTQAAELAPHDREQRDQAALRQEQSRPRQVEFVEGTAESGVEDDGGPSVGELLVALSKIPPQQRQAIVLREFEGRSYAEIAQILDVTTSALETLLFRATTIPRRGARAPAHLYRGAAGDLARAADGRLGRKERRRLRDHLSECPDCARFASLQHRNRRALKGLMLVPIPLSLTFFKGLEGTATAATMPAAASGVAAVGATTVAAEWRDGRWDLRRRDRRESRSCRHRGILDRRHRSRRLLDHRLEAGGQASRRSAPASASGRWLRAVCSSRERGSARKTNAPGQAMAGGEGAPRGEGTGSRGKGTQASADRSQRRGKSERARPSEAHRRDRAAVKKDNVPKARAGAGRNAEKKSLSPSSSGSSPGKPEKTAAHANGQKAR